MRKLETYAIFAYFALLAIMTPRLKSLGLEGILFSMAVAALIIAFVYLLARLIVESVRGRAADMKRFGQFMAYTPVPQAQLALPAGGSHFSQEFERALSDGDEDDECYSEDEVEGTIEEPEPDIDVEPEHPIVLAANLTLEANDIVGAGINIFGVKGSGKTGAAARIAEQFARWRVPFVVFDIKGDFVSLVTDRCVPNGFVGAQERAPRGRSILQCGLQAMYDLRTWQTPERQASLICIVVEEMLEIVAQAPEGELTPCLVFLDEAEYWLPQSRPSYLSEQMYRRLLDAFHTLATMGRSRGLTPVIATQRIAKVNKDIIAQAELNILMKATLDIDLGRYHEYFNKALASDEQIRGFRPGEAIVCLPDGRQLVTRFLERRSRHISHTPHITQALRRFQERKQPVELQQATEEREPETDALPATKPAPAVATATEPISLRRGRRATIEEALAAWNNGANGVRKLERELGIPYSQARDLAMEMARQHLITID